MPVRERIVGSAAVERIGSTLGDRARNIRDIHGRVDLVCDPDQLVGVMTTLRDDVGCRFFTFLSAVDRTELEEDKTEYGQGLEVLIHVYSPTNATHVTVHVPIDMDQPRCPTISGVYSGALWHERECYEMFGIEFEDHPHLVNLYLPEDFEGHPGLKAFKLPARTTVKDWPGAKDPEEAAAGGR